MHTTHDELVCNRALAYRIATLHLYNIETDDIIFDIQAHPPENDINELHKLKEALSIMDDEVVEKPEDITCAMTMSRNTSQLCTRITKFMETRYWGNLAATVFIILIISLVLLCR